MRRTRAIFELLSALILPLFVADLCAQVPDRLSELSLANHFCACPGAGSFPVNASYVSDPRGGFCMVPNISGTRFNFSDRGTRQIVPDPTVMTLNGKYYATGTGDEFAAANFGVYQSTDLTDWRLVRLSSGMPRLLFRDNRVGGINTINGRQFRDLWAPHLFVDPNVPGRVFVSFSATLCINNVCNLANGTDLGQSLYIASVSQAGFLSGAYFADENTAEPLPFGYTVNNQSGPTLYDGGFAQGGGFKPIPTTGNFSMVGSAPGQLALSGARPAYLTMAGMAGPFGRDLLVEDRAYLGIDSFTFYDPATHRNHLLYVWEGSSEDPRYLGFNIGSHALRAPNLLDANSYEFYPMALNRNATITNPGYGNAPNGCAGEYGSQNFCIAEGPAVFFRNGWYYLVFSRNPTTASTYQLVYRKARSYAELALRRWDDADIGERLLVYSSERAVPLGKSYGHGEVFKSLSEDRYYVIFHQKDSGTRWTRSPMIKELTFDPLTGDIESVSDGDSRGLKNDLNSFMIPRTLCPN